MKKENFLLLLLILSINVEVKTSGELGSIECVDGKWKVDTRLMALIMTCPLPLDGNTESVLKMAKCAMNKLGVYDGERLSDDFVETICTVFPEGKMQEGCISQANLCSFLSGMSYSWETAWPVFLTCIVPWAMTLCNI